MFQDRMGCVSLCRVGFCFSDIDNSTLDSTDNDDDENDYDDDDHNGDDEETKKKRSWANREMRWDDDEKKKKKKENEYRALKTAGISHVKEKSGDQWKENWS